MSNQTAIRPYEMSVWTLRDTFLASLRVPGIENKGQIEEPKMRLNTDGTQELSFKIPMYMYDWVTLEKEVESENEEGSKLISTPAFKKIENPRWYDVKHGLLMVGLRKIKVIFNKGTADEDVYEFLVTDITEEHADDNSLYCNVNCSGLAFQELGKKGYNISLSADTYYLDYDEAIEQQEEAQTEEERPELPINNINYWCDKVFKNSDWEYSIQMDWATYDGFILHRFFKDDIQLPDGTITVDQNNPYIGYIGEGTGNPIYISSAYTGIAHLNDAVIFPDEAGLDDSTFVQERFITYTELLESERDALNDAREKYGLRRNDKIYEDDYTASWDISDDNILTPTHYEKFKEKRRMVESNESNIYNATQTIAEAFGVYCQYKYHYDNNYHIIKKEVIFYNDFMDELHGIIDLSYNYDVSSITRTLDSNDICTKLIVRSVDDDTSPSGKLSIMNTPANKTGENYLLNFDYLYQTGSIEKDQYEAIPKFELEVKKLNKKLITLEESKMRYEREINEYEATIAIEKPSIVAAEEQVEKAYAGLLAITKNETGTIEVMPKMGVLLKGENGYYINISTQGVLEDTIQVYKECYGNEVQGDPISKGSYQIIKDNTGNIIRLDGFQLDELQAAKYNCYYLKYSYRPELYYENIINTFSQRSLQSQQALEEAQEKLEVAQAAYDEVVEEHDDTLEQKQELIADFEKMMGPALREGTWQPDTYDDYGDYRVFDFEFTNTIIDGKVKDNYIELKWDDEPFDEEQLGYYNLGVNTDPIYYPCIKLDSNLLSSIKDYLNNEDLDYTLQFKYDEVLKGGAVLSNGTWSQTQTWNNKTYSASTLDELENAILLDKLKAEGYVAQDAETINTDTISDHILLAARQACGLSIHSPRFLTLGSEMTVGFLQDKTTLEVTPVLVLLGAEDHDINFENNAMLCISSIQTLNNTTTIDAIESDATAEETRIITDYSAMQLKRIINPIYSFESEDTHIIKDYSTDYTYVYPRLYIQDMSLKTSEDQLKLSIVNDNTIKNLQNYYDYNLLARDDGYYITIEGQRLIENGEFDTIIHVDYVMSNAELNIYLDALEVMQSSAFPQVSYSVTVSMLNEKFMHKAYRQLNRIAHINDFELKFENVLGYIAELNLDLDHPWEDTIDVKNYKTKFEDLFTKIVASTEQMKANATVYNKAAAAFNFAGDIKSDTLNDALSATSLSLAFTKGNLTIDDRDGIRAESQDGIVMMNSDGIFCATEKNGNGEWKWNSSILPTGINASLLKAGTIDTNLIRIYAGDNLRFQMNANGLYAYRAKDADEADQDQYVVHNSDGLFLIAEKGTKPIISTILKRNVVIDEKSFEWPIYSQDEKSFETVPVENNEPLTTDVQRVEVSWDGLKLRNWQGEETFYADPDTGDLIIGGTLLQNSSYITVPTDIVDEINQESMPITNNTTSSMNANNTRLKGLEKNGESSINKDDYSFKDYVIDALVEDINKQQEEEKQVRFLSPKVAAIKVNSYIDFRASAVTNELINSALQDGARIGNRINSVSTALNNFINIDYQPLVAAVTDIVNKDTIKVTTLPSNPKKYDSVILTQNIVNSNEEIIYKANTTYWYDGTIWQELNTTGISLGTNQELNLFGANATFSAGSELKMLAGGKLHLFGGEVYISNTDIANNQTEQQKLEETPLNGIVLDNEGLAIYSNKNITIGTQRSYQNGANETTYIAGIEIDGSSGSFTVVTDAENGETTEEKNAYKNSGINFYRIITEDNQKKLKEAITINGNGLSAFGSEVLIATEEKKDANNIGLGEPDTENGSYLWMHDVNNKKQLDIGTIGDFTIGSGGNFIIDSGNIDMTTAQFALNIVSKDNPEVTLMSMSATGKNGFDTFYAEKIESKSIVSTYIGPSTIKIGSANASSTSTDNIAYFSTLNSAIANLINNHYLTEDITIIYDENITNDNYPVNIEGVLGSGRILIQGQTKIESDIITRYNTLNGNITITGCTAQIEINGLNIKETRSIPNNGNSSEGEKQALIKLQRNSSIIIKNCKLDGNLTITNPDATSSEEFVITGREILIESDSAQVELDSNEMINAYYGIYQTAGMCSIINCFGHTVVGGYIQKSLALIEQGPTGDYIESTGGHIFSSSTQYGSEQGMSSAEGTFNVPEGEQYTSFKAIQVKSGSNSIWDNSNASTNGYVDVMTGCYGTTSAWWYGCIWFDFSFIHQCIKAGYNFNLSSAVLTIRRQAKGGAGGEHDHILRVYSGLNRLESVAVAADFLDNNSTVLGTIKGAYRDDVKAISLTGNILSNLQAAISNNNTINVDQLCLIFFDYGVGYHKGGYSDNYARYYGLVPGYEPTLTMTYTFTRNT